MTKKEKIERLKSILANAKLVPIEVRTIKKGFSIEVIQTPINSSNEIIFDNIDDAVFVIKKSKNITNMSEMDMKDDILKHCDKEEIDPNKEFSIIFSIT